MSHNDFDARMKSYEASSDLRLPPRGYTIIRIDGHNFHTWTKRVECKRPFDPVFHHAMTSAANNLLHEIQDARLAYVQSDEISILVSCFNPHSEPWFGNRIQKVSSIAASLTTKFFNVAITGKYWLPADFDARCFSLPEPIEVYNYFLWRQKDCYRNAVQGWAIHQIGPKAIHGLNNRDAILKAEEAKGDKFSQTAAAFRYGTLVLPDSQSVPQMFNDDPEQIYRHVPIPAYMRYEPNGELVQRISQSSSKDGKTEGVRAVEGRNQEQGSGIQTEAR